MRIRNYFMFLIGPETQRRLRARSTLMKLNIHNEYSDCGEITRDGRVAHFRSGDVFCVNSDCDVTVGFRKAPVTNFYLDVVSIVSEISHN